MRKVSRKQSRAQIWKAMSDESTSWYDPSIRTILTPRTSKPATGPLWSESRNPFSTEGMYSDGIRPPVTSFSKTNCSVEPSGIGSRVPLMWAYWPEPPVCLRCL